MVVFVIGAIKLQGLSEKLQHAARKVPINFSDSMHASQILSNYMHEKYLIDAEEVITLKLNNNQS